ncbi:hypothetical protein D3C73_747680 [compost metagenome]
MEDRHAILDGQVIERLADLVDESGHGRGSRMGLGLGLDEGAVEAPARLVEVLIPQVTLGTGQACRTLGAPSAAGQTTRLAADTHNGGPAKGFAATALDREMILAENRLRELNAALERLWIDLFRLGQVAQFKLVAFAQAVALLGVILDQDAACP